MIKELTAEIKNVKPALQQTHCYVQPGCQLYNEDCLETLRQIETGSVDLMLTDPPYGTTGCEWDNHINIPLLWQEWERILKPNGTWIFTAAQPFTSTLITSRAGFFKYSLVWDKKFCGAFALAKIRPMIVHEDVLIFSRGRTVYNPQVTKRRNSIKEGGKNKSESAPVKYFEKMNKVYDEKQPVSILEFPRDLGRTIHPTQKPIDLFRYLLRTYSNENDMVFDGYSGSGTTAAACLKEKRRFIGAELSKEYFDKSVERLELLRSKPELF